MICIADHNIEVFSFNTIIIGSGASGFNAADCLFDYGQPDIAVVTEGVRMGTSRNTGSDKQTYYKLTLAGDEPDSVRQMAQTLFDGGCMHGDLALCEAAMSTRCFYKLADIGVPFPHNEYGEYTGYKTDHDPRQRATSAGPLTSQLMTEKLEKRVRAKNIPIFDGYKVIALMTDNGVCKGALALNKNEPNNKNKRFVLFNCTNIILATGGPAGLYTCSVYPKSQIGSHGIALEAGVGGRNLAEWQYGIASVKFRWNLSGSYQQVIPRYISMNQHGGDVREFLTAHFPDARQMLNAIFLKGYQWPFDVRKIKNYGSSLIDKLVHDEIHQHERRVYLDFRQNPSALQPDFGTIGKEAYDYLKKSGALQATPVERLKHLNRPAFDLFLKNGIDLRRERLEIAVCAQHNNGGLSVGHWWETNIKHLFAVGEAAGTHGVYRPGGSALNAGQVGSTRAAMYIARNYQDEPLSETDFEKTIKACVTDKINLTQSFLNKREAYHPSILRRILSDSMSRHAAHIRRLDTIRRLKEQTAILLAKLPELMNLSGPEELCEAFEMADLLVARYAYTAAMENYIASGGQSRGSCLVINDTAGHETSETGKATGDVSGSETSGNTDIAGKIQETRYEKSGCHFTWEEARPIPETDVWFENVWRKFI